MADETKIIYKYLDKEGLSSVWSKIKENFATTIEIDNLNENLTDSLNDIWLKFNEIEGLIGDSAVNSVDDLTIEANNGKISTALGLNLNTVAGTIELIATGKSATDENKVLSAFSYAPFVKDGILESVQLVEVAETPEGSTQAPGTYLKFTFNTDSGKDVIYVNVSDLLNVYEGSKYISIVDNKTIELNYVQLESDLKGTFVTVENFNTAISNLNEKIATNLSSIEALQSKLGIVETQSLSNKDAIDAHKLSIEALQKKDVDHENNMLTLDEKISSNLTAIQQLAERLGLKADQTSLDALDVRVTTAESDIDSLEDRLANLEGAVGPDGELVTISITQVTDFDRISDSEIGDICNMDVE